MLANTLVTNEVKDSAGTEIEFQRLESVGRKTIFAKATESPNLPYRLTVSHIESGTGMKLRRRSVVRFDKTTISGVDDITPVTTSAYLVLDHPVGASEDNAQAAHVIANILSFVGSLGASTTILYDGTGNGAVALLTGGL